jgi:hypothetical protein
VKAKGGVREALAHHIESGHVGVLENADSLWIRLSSKYPFSDLGRLRWDLVPGHELYEASIDEPFIEDEQLYFQKNRARLTTHLRRLLERACADPEQLLFWLGDHESYSLSLSATLFLTHWEEVFSWPMHHYILPESLSWCLNYTFERDLYFGHSTPELLEYCSRINRRRTR